VFYFFFFFFFFIFDPSLSLSLSPPPHVSARAFPSLSIGPGRQKVLSEDVLEAFTATPADRFDSSSTVDVVHLGLGPKVETRWVGNVARLMKNIKNGPCPQTSFFQADLSGYPYLHLIYYSLPHNRVL
jgi:hypothetical protein